MAQRPEELVERWFTAPAPTTQNPGNASAWQGLPATYIRTFSGWVYAAFVIDVFSRRVVGWQLSASLHTDLTLDALEMGIRTRKHSGHDLSQLIHHSDRGVQGDFTSHRLGDSRAVLHLRIIHPQVARLQGRGKIERSFGTRGRRPGLSGVVGLRGDRQFLADRLDPKSASRSSMNWII